MDNSVSLHSIFVWETGRPCHLFVEATSVRERPKLVRRIIKHGGIVVNAVREAEILLAENNTKEALELLDAWQGDKVVLGTRWAAFCIDQDRLVGQNHGWGGFSLNREDLVNSLDLSGDNEDESDEGQTQRKPVSRSNPASTSISQRKSKSNPSRSSARPPHREPSSNRTPRRSTPTDGRGSELIQFPSSKSSQVPGFQYPTEGMSHNESYKLLSTDPGPSYQLQYPSSSQPSTQQQFFPSMYSNLLQSQQLQHQVSDFSQSMVFPQFASFPPSTAPLNPHQIEYLEYLCRNPQVATQALEQQQQVAQSAPERPTPEDVLSSDGYVMSEDDEPSPRKNKGKARARSRSYDREVQTAIRSRPMSPKKPAVVEERGFFTNDWGISKKVYVMVDLKNRRDLLKVVKQNQGTVVSEMELADYIILNARSNQYQSLLGTLPISKVALSPAWLEACGTEERIVDMAPYVIDAASGVGPGVQRKRPGLQKTRKVETADCESEEETSLHSKKAGATPMKSTPQRPPETIADDTRSGTRSPSPPTHIVEFTGGKNIFTPEDRVWFFKYLEFKLKRNPQASVVSLIREVAAKAPHHSEKSWQSTWRKCWGDEMRALRARLQKSSSDPPPTPSTAAPSSEARWRSPPPLPSLQDLNTTPSDPPMSPQNGRYVLKYPQDSSSPVNTSSSTRMPPSSAPVSQTSTQATPSRIVSESLKRKDSPLGAQMSPTSDNRQIKKPKIQSENVIDVDAFPDQWFQSPR